MGSKKEEQYMARYSLKGMFANVDKGTDGEVYEFSVTDLASEERMSGLGSVVLEILGHQR